MKKCIMAIMAHADDLEIFAGGTMAKFTEQGYQGILVMLTGNMSGAAVGKKKYQAVLPREAAPVREQETRNGAAILGVKKIESLNFQELVYSNGTKFVWPYDPGYQYEYPGYGPTLPSVASNRTAHAAYGAVPAALLAGLRVHRDLDIMLRCVGDATHQRRSESVLVHKSLTFLSSNLFSCCNRYTCSFNMTAF